MPACLEMDLGPFTKAVPPAMAEQSVIITNECKSAFNRMGFFEGSTS